MKVPRGSSNSNWSSSRPQSIFEMTRELQQLFEALEEEWNRAHSIYWRPGPALDNYRELLRLSHEIAQNRDAALSGSRESIDFQRRQILLALNCVRQCYSDMKITSAVEIKDVTSQFDKVQLSEPDPDEPFYYVTEVPSEESIQVNHRPERLVHVGDGDNIYNDDIRPQSVIVHEIITENFVQENPQQNYYVEEIQDDVVPSRKYMGEVDDMAPNDDDDD